MVFGFRSQPATKSKELISQPKEVDLKSHPESKPAAGTRTPSSGASRPTNGAPQLSGPAVSAADAVPSQSEKRVNGGAASQPPNPPSQSRAAKRFSWRAIVESKGVYERKPMPPSAREEAAKEATVRQEYVVRQVLRSRSDKLARESALVVRDLIVGPFAAPSAAPPKSSKVAVSAVPSAQKMRKVRAQLSEPKAAKKVIAQLRQLPSSDVPVVVGKTASGEDVKLLSRGPIHAVCLADSDPEISDKHFAHLDKVPAAHANTRERSLDLSTAVDGIASVTTSSYEKLKEVFADLDIVNLITVPDWGLGKPATEPGLLSGAIPTAKAVIDGVQEITPQLMALGYATGKTLFPSHAGVYPPTDRMSVITYWWGLEVVIPEPSVNFLSNVPSIAHTVVNFLTALSVASGGVREILPFIRYISQYIDSEFSSIRDEDQGKGVVCAATWLMPAALVPRAWDFPDPPSAVSPGDGDNLIVTPSPVPAPPGSTPKDARAPNAGDIMLTPPVPKVGTTAAIEKEGVPAVTVTPPTPPTSETLGKATGATMAASAAVRAENARLAETSSKVAVAVVA